MRMQSLGDNLPFVPQVHGVAVAINMIKWIQTDWIVVIYLFAKFVHGV